MEHFVDTLELSVRATETLRHLNVDSITKLQMLTQKEVLSVPGVGRKTWNEIAELRYELTDKMQKESAEGRALALVRQLNHAIELLRDEGYYLAVSKKTGDVLLCKVIG